MHVLISRKAASLYKKHFVNMTLHFLAEFKQNFEEHFEVNSIVEYKITVKDKLFKLFYTYLNHIFIKLIPSVLTCTQFLLTSFRNY